MIPVAWEPKGLAPDAEPLATPRQDARIRQDAIDGSAALRDAMLAAIPRPSPQPHICKCCGEPMAPKTLMVGAIQSAVAAYFQMSPLHMVSAQRSRRIARPRQIAMYLASELTAKSLPDIGRRFGGRDHTTVLYAVRAVKFRIETDPEVAEDVAILRARLAG